ncbi:hypothetical protein IFM89_015068 [Coptis chinensis]|uniref:Pentatricopeptide repeat-containing protein n=1 Tax=Coptis chinensis TaxID=261450 RepID=A0A835H6C4_9MAGN|nr:hypothetical protein IFM89_015068 [Coptis chinensis]
MARRLVSPLNHVIAEKLFPTPHHSIKGQYVDDLMESRRDTSDSLKEPPGRNVSKKDKIKFLVDTLLGLKESKEAVYGALDAWVAWEKTFPLASLRIAMGTLEKEQEWHRVIQA